MHTAAGSSRRQYKNVAVHRGERGDDEDLAEESKHELTVTKRTLDTYLEVVKKNTEIFTLADPESIINEIGGYLQEQGHAVKLDAKKYKLKAIFKTEEAEEEVEGEKDENSFVEAPIEMTVKILQVEGATPAKYCIEFSRNGGDQLQFFEEFSKIRDELAELKA